MFKLTGQRGKYLDLVFESMSKIKSSTVDVERLFSISNHIITKFRCSLGDETIDDIIFLKNYFLNLDKYDFQFNWLFL